MNVLVLKVKAGKATVMVDNGEFMTIPAKDGMKEGSAFDYTPHVTQKKTWKRFAFVTAASLLLCVLGFGALGTFAISSYIDININPGVRLAVNQWGKVISLEAINEDGGVLINEIHGQFMQDPGNSVKQIIGQAWKDGTLKASGHILLTISDNDLQRAQRTENELIVSAFEVVKEAGLAVDINLQKLDRDSFEALRKNQEILDDKNKSRVYNPNLWYSEKGGLYIEEAKYVGSGIIKVEFSREVIFSGNENISVEDMNGIQCPIQVKEITGEKLLIQCDGLKEDSIYKITIENIGTEKKTLTSFLYINLLGTEGEDPNIPNNNEDPYDNGSSNEGSYEGEDDSDDTDAESPDTSEDEGDSEYGDGNEINEDDEHDVDTGEGEGDSEYGDSNEINEDDEHDVDTSEINDDESHDEESWEDED